jgi:hypothetical protein
VRQFELFDWWVRNVALGEYTGWFICIYLTLSFG